MLSTFFLLSTSAIVFILYNLVYRIFFHSLAKVPGPFLARITKLWLVWHVRKGQCHSFMPALHKCYGPIVRIAPDQVLVCSEDAIRTGYSAGTFFTKGDWYQVTAIPDKSRRGDEHLDLFSEMNKERYRMQRRAIGPAYSIAGMEKHEALLDGYIDRYVARLKSLDGRAVDLAIWSHIFSLDALSTFTVSKSMDYATAGNDGGHGAASKKVWACFTVVGLFPGLVHAMHSIPKVGMMLLVPACLALGLGVPGMFPIFGFCIPEIMERLKKLASTAGVQLMGDRPGLVVSHGKDGTGEVDDDDDNREEGKEKDLLASLMKLHHDKEARFRPSWVLGIAITNFGAGHETMMITLASTIYHTFSHSAVLTRLRREMKESSVTTATGYTDIVTKVPLFMAVLKESMRIYPVIGSWLPRVVPSSGATVCNTYLPPGTTMGVSLYAAHHDPALFPHPETFDPDRWLPGGSEDKKKDIGRLDSLWMGFGGGSRSCPGQYLARFFVIKLLARLVLEFDVDVSGTPELGAWFLVNMRGVDVRFLERKADL